jgi:hypothetical protein
MTTTSTLDSPTRIAHGRVELAFTLELAPGNDSALVRTLALLHRRRCRVIEAGYRSRLNGDDRLDLRLQAPAAHAHCVGAWLSALVDVRQVKASGRSGWPDGHTGDAPRACAEQPTISKGAWSSGNH